jgi:hypothetical protein
MRDEGDMFDGLGWEGEIRSLKNPRVSFNPSPKYDIRVENQYNNDYELTLFSQPTQVWRWRM